jgi:hypothetical protein
VSVCTYAILTDLTAPTIRVRCYGQAYAAAQRCVEKQPLYPVPLHLRNAPTRMLAGVGVNGWVSECAGGGDSRDESCAKIQRVESGRWLLL